MIAGRKWEWSRAQLATLGNPKVKPAQKHGVDEKKKRNGSVY